jgi:prolyl-tRNA editing enzyme YbaK/EbsC (Cys-tRNA(Pro) deacylase)
VSRRDEEAAAVRTKVAPQYAARMSSWPEPVERVAEFLRRNAAEARIEEFPEGTPTAVDAAKAAGCKLSQIVKSLVFSCDGRAFVVVMVPGDRRADSTKVAEAAGCGVVRIATAEEVEQATGFAAGAVAPFPLPQVARVFVDRGLLTHKRVWIGAGSPNHMATLAPPDLVRLARAQPMDAVERAT